MERNSPSNGSAPNNDPLTRAAASLRMRPETSLQKLPPPEPATRNSRADSPSPPSSAASAKPV